MMLLVVGCNFRNAPIGLRERLGFNGAIRDRALDELHARFNSEVAILSTCNRVEVYLGRADSPAGPDAERVADFLADWHGLPAQEIRPHLYAYAAAAAVHHLFRVAASLDSLVVGEGQIAGQVREAYEQARSRRRVGPLLNALFQYALRAAKRVRTETGIARGRVSIASAALDFVHQVFDHLGDKTVLVIGAGKMSRLTLRHLRDLRPERILVTNRSSAAAVELANRCGGRPVPWDYLDDALAEADIVLSATGAPEPIVTWPRFRKVLARRVRGPLLILDLAVPRDFDPRIHDGEQAYLFNTDDLNRLCENRLAERRSHVAEAEALVGALAQDFLRDWARRQNGPAIEQLTRTFEAKRHEVTRQLFAKLDGRLSDADKVAIESALRTFQNQVLHGPISALAGETTPGETGRVEHSLLDALRQLFGLGGLPSAPLTRAPLEPVGSRLAA